MATVFEPPRPLQEQFDQETTVVSLEIERTVQQIMNEALEVERAAEANATLIRAIASANVSPRLIPTQPHIGMRRCHLSHRPLQWWRLRALWGCL